MPNAFADIKSQVEEKLDGRSIAEEKHARWANLIRKQVSLSAEIAGVHGLYFLFREATVVNGSVAGQARYEIPDDYICDLWVFYDKMLISKTAPGLLNLLRPNPDTSGTPTWIEMRGTVFEIHPAPSDTGKEILLAYNGLPGLIPATSNDSFEDFFMVQFPALHVFGMTEQAAESLNMYDLADRMSNRYLDEQKKLQFQNRRWHIQNTFPRFQNWDEWEEIKQKVFPQFSL